MSEIVFKPLGHIKAQFSDADVRAESKDLEGELEIYPEFEPALEGIDGYSHLFILAYFDRLRADQIGPLQVKPRRLVNRGFKLEELPLLGVFALDSPTRSASRWFACSHGRAGFSKWRLGSFRWDADH